MMSNDHQRWLYHGLSGLAAEKLLIEKGIPGSFLIRESRSSPGNYTLSVRRDDSFAHIRIQKAGDFLSFIGGEKFSTLSELINYYVENPVKLKENNGSLIILRNPLAVEDITTESARWFHGRQTALEAQNLLLQKGKNGSFLVRQSVRQPGSYVLSVLTGSNTVSHILINRLSNSKFDMGDNREFSSLSQIVDHYTSYPIMVKDGDLVSLKQPLNVTRLTVTSLDQRIAQLEKEGSKQKHTTGFLEEFEELHQGIHEASRSEAGKQFNLAKNRFKYILPFDLNRVILHNANPDVPGSDYINASYISTPSSLLQHGTSKDDSCPSSPPSSLNPSTRGSTRHSSQYIATQGVLPNTVNDMWFMIWQERASIVILLTKESERGRNKCEKYWPTELEGPLIIPLPSGKGTLKVNPIDVENLISYLVRELKVTFCQNSDQGEDQVMAAENDDKEESFTVYLFHFLAWPDVGVPSNPTDLLNLLSNISTYKECIETTGPIIVQCSSGIGRSGTLIVTDMLINYIREECSGGLHADIDVARTVQAVRQQRSGMVQTEAQYRLIYKALQQFVGSLLIRAQMRNALQPYGIDYTNLKQAPINDSGSCACCSAIPNQPHQQPSCSSSTFHHFRHHNPTRQHICQPPLPVAAPSSLPIGRGGFWVGSPRSPPPLTSGSYHDGMMGRKNPPSASISSSSAQTATSAVHPLDVNQHPHQQQSSSTTGTTSRRWYKLSSASR